MQTCKVDEDARACALDSLPIGASVLVVPPSSANAQCLNGEAYAFQVTRGGDAAATDKVHIALQGGGACWTSKRGSFVPGCTQSLTPLQLSQLSQLPPSDETRIDILYCSGDVHVGETERYRGRANVQSVLDWVAQQQTLMRDVQQIHLSGCSAGALGLQMLAPEMVRQLRQLRQLAPASDADIRVTLDSFVGVFPPDAVPQLLQQYGLAPQASVEQILSDTLAQLPDVSFVQWNSTHDAVQIGFYDAVGVTLEGAAPRTVTPEQWAREAHDQMARVAQAHGNYSFREIPGARHCFGPH